MVTVRFLPIYPLKYEQLPPVLRADPEMPSVPRVGDRIEVGGFDNEDLQAVVLAVAWVYDTDTHSWWAGVQIQ